MLPRRRNEAMSPVIRISDELYGRLENHAVGFDTPANVIERALDEYEKTNQIPSKNPSKLSSTAKPNDVLARVGQAFESFFKVAPRPFGQKTSPYRGFSDDHKGVQWNIRIHKNTGEAFLGVNLEGMTYSDWPIASLLMREKDAAKLPSLVAISGAEKIYVGLYRDSWQAATKPSIEEREIKGSDTLLCDITDLLWATMIEESLDCLNADKDYRGRGKQFVTLKHSGKRVEREVSPHLWVHTKVWTSVPDSVEETINMIELSHSRLLPIYKFVEDRSQ